jgi:hypothetical protein
MNKEEIIALVRECTARLGHAPSVAEFHETGQVSKRLVRKNFGSHTRMLAESGMMREGPGYPISMRSLFLDWAQVVRSLGRVPSVIDYDRLSKYSVRPLANRFASWRAIPAGMLACARREGLEEEWRDVLEVALRHQSEAGGRSRTSKETLAITMNSSARRPWLDQGPTYGQPLPHSPLSYAPTNEAGVLVLFGSLARQLGFVILRVQAEFPDCEALREVAPNHWQRVRIEFEYESYSFLKHMHAVEDCDLIVCWKHNWRDCPLEVIELENQFS